MDTRAPASEPHDKASRISVAREVVSILLHELEMNNVPIAQSLMKAKRIARLLRDADAQAWLDLELRGYPSQFSFATLGGSARYARQSGRVMADERYWPESLPAIEAGLQANQAALQGLRFPSTIAPSASSSNEYDHAGAAVKSAVDGVVNAFALQLRTCTEGLKHNAKLFYALKSALHAYATDVHLAISLGDLTGELFLEARVLVDSFVRTTCPAVAEQLLSVYDRVRENHSEAFAQALTTCRRVLLAVADHVFPARASPYVDSKGKSRPVGPDHYKNRLLAFLEERQTSGTSLAIHDAEISHLADRLEAVNDKLCKGVHANITRQETALAIIYTYVFLAEVARAAAPAKSQPKSIATPPTTMPAAEIPMATPPPAMPVAPPATALPPPPATKPPPPPR